MISYTNDTKIIDNIEQLDEDIISKIPIPGTHLWNNWTKINNQLYYYKLFNFNELIGEYLCKYLNLDSVHNELAFKDDNLYLITKSFVEDNYIYERSRFGDFDNLLNKCINKKNIDEIITNHMKLFAIDIYMRQADREHCSNIMYKINKDTKYILLTKVYDFENSFKNHMYYNNPYYDINFNKYEFKQLFKLYPQLEQYLKKLNKVDLYYIICSILSDYKLNMDSKEFMFYEKQADKSEKILRKIL